MSKILKSLSVMLMLVLLAGCGDLLIGKKVSVEPSNVAKILTKDGYQEGIIQGSRFRLPQCMAYCDDLVTMDVSDIQRSIPIKVHMPQDELNIDFDLTVSFYIRPDQYEFLFSRLPVQPTSDSRIKHISVERAYNTYARDVITREARSYMTRYSISELMGNRETITVSLRAHLTKVVENETPFNLINVGINNMNYPAPIVAAQEAAGERRASIASEEAQLDITRIQMSRKMEEAGLQRALDIEKANAEVEVNSVLMGMVTEEYLRYRQLDVLERLVESDNAKIVPLGILDSTAGQVAVGNQLSK